MTQITVKSLENMEIVSLNVGGNVFEITNESLKQFPDTRLAKLSTFDSEYNVKKNQYFFNRNPEMFNFILDLYRTGSIHLPKNLCSATIQQELEYWDIPLDYLSECCYKTYFEDDNNISIMKQIRDLFEAKTDGYTEAECRASKWVNVKRHIWRLLDQPNSSLPAKIFAVIFLVVVVISIITFAMETLSGFRVTFITDEELAYMKNTSTLPDLYKLVDLNNPKIKLAYTSKLLPELRNFEYFYVVFFYLEFMFHLMTCPEKKRFFLSMLNVLDLVMCISVKIAIIITLVDEKLIVSNRVVGMIYTILYSTIILRLFRIFRLLKHYPGLGILYLAFKSKIKDIFMLLLCFLFASVIFGSLIYYAEFSEGTTFPNMFVSIWWAVVTMTTVGYGDHYPKSFAGCIVGGICALSGVMFLAMPIALLASNFSDYFNQNQVRRRFLKFRKKIKSYRKITFIMISANGSFCIAIIKIGFDAYAPNIPLH